MLFIVRDSDASSEDKLIHSIMMSSTSEQEPAAMVVTTDDHGAILQIVVPILITFILLSLAIRLYIRLGVIGPWKIDDTVSVMAMVSSIAS